MEGGGLGYIGLYGMYVGVLSGEERKSIRLGRLYISFYLHVRKAGDTG